MFSAEQAQLIVTAAPTVSASSRRKERNILTLLAVVLGALLITSVVLALAVWPGMWVASSLIASLAIYYIGGTLLLRRGITASGPVRLVPEARIPAYERMKKWHAAQVAGIARVASDHEAERLELLLSRLEWTWAGLWIEHDELKHEEGRQRADHPWTPAQRETISLLGDRRWEASQQANELERIGRALPERVAALAGAGGMHRVDRDGLRMAMIEAEFGIENAATR
jgi:hypothetical protein